LIVKTTIKSLFHSNFLLLVTLASAKRSAPLPSQGCCREDDGLTLNDNRADRMPRWKLPLVAVNKKRRAEILVRVCETALPGFTIVSKKVRVNCKHVQGSC
jgi:hypothetical protein